MQGHKAGTRRLNTHFLRSGANGWREGWTFSSFLRRISSAAVMIVTHFCMHLFIHLTYSLKNVSQIFFWVAGCKNILPAHSLLQEQKQQLYSKPTSVLKTMETVPALLRCHAQPPNLFHFANFKAPSDPTVCGCRWQTPRRNTSQVLSAVARWHSSTLGFSSSSSSSNTSPPLPSPPLSLPSLPPPASWISRAGVWQSCTHSYALPE